MKSDWLRTRLVLVGNSLTALQLWIKIQIRDSLFKYSKAGLFLPKKLPKVFTICTQKHVLLDALCHTFITYHHTFRCLLIVSLKTLVLADYGAQPYGNRPLPACPTT